MKLLVFAHRPPPLHGQSAMVATLLDGLKADPEIEVFHVDARFSDTTRDIGAWKPAKLGRLLSSCFRAWRLRWRHGPAVLYYVPAPAKRSALYRDIAVMLLCRPFFPKLVLHWHASGLGQWLASEATWFERLLARAALGRADLSIVLAPELESDARLLQPKTVRVVPNSIPDPGEPPVRRLRAAEAPGNVLFLGLCTREKGLFDALEAVALANSAGRRCRLTVAGGFASAAEQEEFRVRCERLGAHIAEYVGFADEDRKRELFHNADVFCFPTRYPHEGQPLTVMEALAADLPTVATRWRSIPSMVPATHVWLVEPGHPAAIATALAAALDSPPPMGALRRHYREHFTPERHLAAMKAALLSLSAARDLV
jgi:glycosyltransferase involved in cell wall biosynthesis